MHSKTLFRIKSYLGSIFLKAEKSVLLGKVCDPVCPKSLAKKCPLAAGGLCSEINPPPDG